jgi:hypothetical protein
MLHIRLPKVTPVVWTSVADSGIRLTMRYLCKPRARRSSGTEIWEKVLDAFAAMPHVDFAYPTSRRFDNAREGKPPMPPLPPEARPPSIPSENETVRDQEQAPE